MLQDGEAKRRTEADYIGEAIVRLGETAGIPAPVLQTLTTLAGEPPPVDQFETARLQQHKTNESMTGKD